jgi:hypothetical protein
MECHTQVVLDSSQGSPPRSRAEITTKFALVLLALVLAAALAACGGGGTASAAVVAQAANATSCDDSGFYMKPQSGNGGKEEIYDCHFAKRLPECVTYDGNIANNSSDVVSGVFSTAIGRRPPCLRERKVAIAKRAAKRATEALAFKKRYYRATLRLAQRLLRLEWQRAELPGADHLLEMGAGKLRLPLVRQRVGLLLLEDRSHHPERLLWCERRVV